MSRADTLTKLPIDEWFRLMGVNPIHANQVQLNIAGADLQNQFCGQLWFQHAWQAGTAIGREALAQAIAEAERNIETYLGYTLIPTYQSDERRATARPNRPELVLNSGRDVRGYNQTVLGSFRKFVMGGQRATTIIEAGATIVYSDEDGDGYDETATLTVTRLSGFTDACETRVYYPGKAASPEWEIRPLTSVTQSGTDWVITFPRHFAVTEARQEALVPALVNGTDDDGFLTTVDVYRVFTDPQVMASLLWEPLSCGCGSGQSCSVCEYAAQSACLLARGDPENAIISYRPATWNAETESFDPTSLAINRAPDLVRLWYLAGLQDTQQECCVLTMDPYWKQVVAQYAAAILSKPTCACVELDINRWQEDLAFVSGATELASYQISRPDLDNPFGTRRGAILAWKAVNAPGIQHGVGALSV